MKELGKKGELFYRKWEEQRTKKWLFVLIHGSGYWGIPVGVSTYLWRINFNLENLKWFEFIASLVIFGIGGIWFGLSQFKRIDQIYLGLNDDTEIIKGIQSIKTGNMWSYENLRIYIEIDETLIIQNELFWFDEKEPSSKNWNECYDLVYSDFKQLQKNRDFDKYSKGKKVKIQIFDNSESNVPLIDKII